MAYSLFTKLLHDEADANIFEFNGDYSSAPKKAVFLPPVGHYSIIKSLNILIADSGSVDAGFYGNNIVLTNGISYGICENNVIIHALNELPIKTIGDYARFTNSVTPVQFGAGNNYINVTKSFENHPMIINGEDAAADNINFAAMLNDNFTGLAKHSFFITGYTLKICDNSEAYLRRKYGYTDLEV